MTSVIRQLPAILDLTIDGIDANDHAKTWATLKMYDMVPGCVLRALVQCCMLPLLAACNMQHVLRANLQCATRMHAPGCTTFARRCTMLHAWQPNSDTSFAGDLLAFRYCALLSAVPLIVVDAAAHEASADEHTRACIALNEVSSRFACVHERGYTRARARACGAQVRMRAVVLMQVLHEWAMRVLDQVWHAHTHARTHARTHTHTHTLGGRG
jgi:hypothetical protein